MAAPYHSAIARPPDWGEGVPILSLADTIERFPIYLETVVMLTTCLKCKMYDEAYINKY